MNIKVTNAKSCCLRYGDGDREFCVLREDLPCEAHNDSFPSNCPILDETITISRQKE